MARERRTIKHAVTDARIRNPEAEVLRAKYDMLHQSEQQYIDAAREDGIEWRGDDMKFFHKVVETTLRWRDMSDEEKAALKAETIRKAKTFVRPVVARPDNPLSQTVHFDPINRSRQLDTLYRAMTPEQREEYDRRMNQ